MSAIEWIAVAFGVACVVLAVRRSVWTWPVGLVQVVLFVWVFWRAKLYSDMGLHVVYVGLQLYGWWQWRAGGSSSGDEPLRVTRLTAAGVAWCVAVAAGGAAGLGYVMDTRTDAALPYADALTTTLSLVAQVLLAKKRLESWAFWVAVDVLAVGVYLVKGLYPTAGLYAVFLGLAVTGWVVWRRHWRAAEAEARGADA